MFDLYKKECKQIYKSLVYIIFVAICILFTYSQYYNDSMKNSTQLKKPVTIEEFKEIGKSDDSVTISYGSKSTEDEEVLEKEVLKRLYTEFSENSYGTYPYGFIQKVVLDETDKNKVEAILKEVTGKNEKEIKEIINSSDILAFDKIKLLENINYNYFKEKMREVDKILGGGSYYNPEKIKDLINVPASYEDAVKEYNQIMIDEKLSNPCGRVFADYLGIVLGLFPVFLVVYLYMRDKKSGMNEIIYSKKISSFKFIVTRYFSVVTMSILPTVIIGIIETIRLSSLAVGAFDYFGILKYVFAWLLPTVMFVVAVATLLSVVGLNILAVVVQVGIWFFSLMSTNLGGDYGISKLLIRFNTLGEMELYREMFSKIVINRIFFIVVSFIIVTISVLIFDLVRKGRISLGGEVKKISLFNKN